MVEKIKAKSCGLCQIFDNTGELDNTDRCPKCNGLLKIAEGHICPSCGRFCSAKLHKCIGCYQLGVEFIACEGCMNHRGPVRHHIECPNWHRKIGLIDRAELP